MKKILCLLSFALLITLTGCSDAKTSLTNGDEALITVGKTEITKDEIYSALKSENGVTIILSKLTNFIIDKEVPITDEIKKEAKDYVEQFTKYMGEDTFKTYIKTLGYETVDEYVEGVVISSVRSNKITDKYIDEKYEDLNKEYQFRKVQILQTSDSKIASEIQLAMKEGKLTFEDALVQYKDKLTTSTFTGKEQVISNQVSLDSSIVKNIFAVEEDNTLLGEYQFNAKLDTFYIVKVVSTNVSKEDASSAIYEIKTIDDQAFAYFLEKYGFVVYDIDLYNGIKSQAPVYLVQDNK